MTIELDHLIVPARDKAASAKLLPDLLGVPRSSVGVGPFCPVYVNDGLTLDFDEATESFPVQHDCFRVPQPAFDAILARIRAANIDYRSTPRGPVDRQVNTQHGGSIVYWNMPGGHVWELLAESCARAPAHAVRRT